MGPDNDSDKKLCLCSFLYQLRMILGSYWGVFQIWTNDREQVAAGAKSELKQVLKALEDHTGIAADFRMAKACLLYLPSKSKLPRIFQ